MSRRTSRRTAGDATTGCSQRWATCRWWRPDRRIWCRPDASPKTTATRTRCSPRSSVDGATGLAVRRAIRRPNRRAGSIPSSWASAPNPWRYPTQASNSTCAAGEAAAKRQWKKFVDKRLEDYGDDRNRPDHDGTSRMSAHLKFGTIHPRTMAADLDQRRAGARAYLRELAFRDFYAAVLHHWPDSSWWNWNRDFDAIKIDSGKKAEQRFEAWKAGETGFPIVDAGMRQLRDTGFMHNRVRMIVASFLVKDLHLPWQWGARWFLDQLVDGDMASNQHGWQWSAGCGTDAAPYFRVFNPTTQAEKFDPSGDYVRRLGERARRRRRCPPDQRRAAVGLPRADRRPQRRTQRGAAPLPGDELRKRQRAAFLRSMSASAAASSAR